jgi:hypothetical protein
MLEWKSRLVILLVFAAVLAVALGDLVSSSPFHNYGW